MSSQQPSVPAPVTGDRWRRRSVAIRVAVILVAFTGIVVIHPWRRVDNAAEVAGVQEVVDAMSEAYVSIRTGAEDVASFTVAADGFSGASVSTAGGTSATALVGAAGEQCVFMHWVGGAAAQAGRLTPGVACAPESIVEVPVKSNDGYVPGTGPPFDVTPLVLEAWTPLWYLVALVVATGIALRAALDLLILGLRPDHLRRRST